MRPNMPQPAPPEAPAQVDAMVLSGCRICGNLTYE